MTQARLNGERRELPEGSTVADVVQMLSRSPSGLAVAVNGEVVARSAWSARVVEEADEIEVLTAAQGG